MLTKNLPASKKIQLQVNKCKFKPNSLVHFGSSFCETATVFLCFRAKVRFQLHTYSNSVQQPKSVHRCF